MTVAECDYTRADLVRALQQAGLDDGDTVFVHAAVEELGSLRDGESAEARAALVFDALMQVVGETGTILVPTYTFSFCRGEVFDVQDTPTPGGPWSTSVAFLEHVRRLPHAVRSRDPIHSVAGVGPRAAELLHDVPATCFGPDSVPERLLRAGGKICGIGVGLHESTFRHHIEEAIGVPFRFKKLFTGYIRDHGVAQKAGWVYSVRIMADNAFPNGARLEAAARASGICGVVQVGRSEVVCVGAKDFSELAWEKLSADPWFTADGPAGDPIELERRRVAGPGYEVSLSEGASMAEMMEKLWRLPRDIVSDAYDVALDALATQLPMTIHEFPSGTECWTWIVPEKWTCRQAYLETLDGRRLFSYADNPLHVVSYSLPFDGVVSRAELLDHLYVHKKISDAVPFVFKYYERDWGLCCTKDMKDSLRDDEYRVVIDSDFSYANLRVGEVVAKGDSDECIVLCSHLCHPAMANDDLSGVVVGMRVMQELSKRQDLRYTYRFLIVPETIGSIAYLDRHAELVPTMIGGLFLEMLGLENPPTLQLSFAADTPLDRSFTQALKAHDYHGWTGKFRTVIGNDERQFNGPGMRVPMLSLSRVLPSTASDWPYREYHSDHDNLALCSLSRLEDSVKLVLRTIETLERDRTPVNKFNGEVFCSRFGVFVDPYTNPEGHQKLFDIMDHIDGTRSISEIAAACEMPFDAVWDVSEELRRHGLVEYR